MVLANVSNEHHQSLLEKYDILVDNISYEYITDCRNARELENIIRILRSGEEGYYPDLLQFAENKLASVKPNSLLLQHEKPLVFKDLLPPEERQVIDSELKNWSEEMKIKEGNLCDEKIVLKDNCDLLLPKIRDLDENKQISKSVKKQTKMKKISSCDYAAWDKYDVDTELNRIELQEQQNQNEAKRAQKEKKEREEKCRRLMEDEIKKKSSLTSTELKAMAEADRVMGNEAFKAGDYNQALVFYNASLAIDSNIITYNNRAITHIKLQNFSSAYQDCCLVLEVEPNNAKALLRRGTALENLGKKSKALEDFEAVVKIEPNNKEAKQAIQRLGGVLPQKSVRMKIVNENQDMREKESALIRLPFSYYRNLSYVDLFNNCYCSALPTSSYHIYPSSHPRNIHCILGDKVEAKRQRDLKAAKEKAKRMNKSKIESSNQQNNNYLIVNRNFENNNNRVASNERSIVLDSNMKENRKNEPALNQNGNGMNVKTKIVRKNNDNEESKGNNEEPRIMLNMMNDFHSQVQINDLNTDVDMKECNNNSENHNGDSEYLKNKIRSPYEFLQVWQSLKNDHSFSQHASLLRSLTPDEFIKAVGNNMDSDMWSIIIKCLKNHFLRVKDIDLVIGYLRSFSQLSRFEITVMFMNECDKQGLKQIFDFVQSHRHNDLDKIRPTYEFHV